MVLAIFVTLTIVIIWLFFLTKKSISFIENSILFMLMGALLRNYLTIMTLNFGKIKVVENQLLYVSLLLYREFIFPIFMLIFVNVYLITPGAKKKLFCFTWAAVFLVTVEAILIYFSVIQFADWNPAYTVVVNVLYLLIGLFFMKLILFVQK